MALKLLVDTSVWLDLAKDYRQQPVIAVLEDLVAAGEIEHIVPQILLDEFARNKERVAIDATRSLQSHFNLVRDAVNRFGEESEKAATLKSLNEVDHAATAELRRKARLLPIVPPRAAPLAFRSLDPFRALREPDCRRRDAGCARPPSWCRI
jgi:hypothetical protein